MRTLRWVLLLTGIVILFYWKLVFTKQFSFLWDWEPVTQSYSWLNFAASSIHKGILPIWDPYRFSGNTFIGEMQTGLFYPLKFLVYILPFDSNGMVPERAYRAPFMSRFTGSMACSAECPFQMVSQMFVSNTVPGRFDSDLPSR
jgi:hypothetical protein